MKNQYTKKNPLKYTESNNTLSYHMLNVELDLSINPNASFWNKICKNIYLMTKKESN